MIKCNTCIYNGKCHPLRNAWECKDYKTKSRLISSIDACIKLSLKQLIVCDNNNSDYFVSIKKDGKEFNLYLKKVQHETKNI